MVLFIADYAVNAWGLRSSAVLKPRYGRTIGLIIGPFVIPAFGLIIGPFLGAFWVKCCRFGTEQIHEGWIRIGHWIVQIVVKVILQLAMIVIFFIWIF